MKSEFYYCIAGFDVMISTFSNLCIDRALPSFIPFKSERPVNDSFLIRCDVWSLEDASPDKQDGDLLDETENEMGIIRLYEHDAGYMLAVKTDLWNEWHYMLADKQFKSIRIYTRVHGNNEINELSSLLRIAYSQSILKYEAVSVHAAAVYSGNISYLFMGESGTGKSTHAQLWIENVSGTALLNDDNPVIRILGNEIYGYGTPWSGKTACYKNLSFRVGGIARLQQSEANRFFLLKDVDAFISVYPGCSVLSYDRNLSNILYDTLIKICQTVTVGKLECRPDREAVLLCYKNLVNQ